MGLEKGGLLAQPPSPCASQGAPPGHVASSSRGPNWRALNQRTVITKGVSAVSALQALTVQQGDRKGMPGVTCGEKLWHRVTFATHHISAVDNKQFKNLEKRIGYVVLAGPEAGGGVGETVGWAWAQWGDFHTGNTILWKHQEQMIFAREFALWETNQDWLEGLTYGRPWATG